jgi:hypothetical protein
VNATPPFSLVNVNPVGWRLVLILEETWVQCHRVE